MSEVDRFGEVLEGYVDLASELLENWTPFLSGVSAKLASNTYVAGDIDTDFPVVAKLVTESTLLIGFEALDALSILTSDFAEHQVLRFGTDPGQAGTKRKLALKGDLKSASGAVLPASRVTVVPDELGPTATAFALKVAYDGLKARTYDGYVVVTPEVGTKVATAEEILVSVTVG